MKICIHTEKTNSVPHAIVLHQKPIAVDNMGIQIPDTSFDVVTSKCRMIKPTMHKLRLGVWPPTEKWDQQPQC